MNASANAIPASVMVEGSGTASPCGVPIVTDAPWIAPDVALGKAWTAAAYGLPSAAQGEKMKELHAFSASISPGSRR